MASRLFHDLIVLLGLGGTVYCRCSPSYDSYVYPLLFSLSLVFLFHTFSTHTIEIVSDLNNPTTTTQRNTIMPIPTETWQDRRGMFQKGKELHQPGRKLSNQFGDPMRRASIGSNSSGTLEKTPSTDEPGQRRRVSCPIRRSTSPPDPHPLTPFFQQ